jgi:uncharacterized protein (DUF2062 family)
MHRRQLSRRAMRGGRLHSWFGDRLLSKELWLPTKESLARAWLVGFAITVVPLPAQSLFATAGALLLRGKLLLCIALTAPIHIPACYFVGEILQGKNPIVVWHEATHEPRHLLSGHTVGSVYLGAVVIGIIGGLIGYLVIRKTWRDQPRPRFLGSMPPIPNIKQRLT